jgi:hypothetical protein
MSKVNVAGGVDPGKTNAQGSWRRASMGVIENAKKATAVIHVIGAVEHMEKEAAATRAKKALHKLKIVLDLFGDKTVPPQDKGKTWAGALVTLVFYTLISYLCVLNLVKLHGTYANGEMIYRPAGASVELNADLLDWTSVPRWDVPPIYVHTDVRLSDYTESGVSTIQKTRLTDRTSFTQAVGTSSHKKVHLTKGASSTVKVPLHSFISDASHTTPAHEAVGGSLHSMVASHAAHQYANSLRILYGEYGLFAQPEADDGADGFYPHTAHLFVRFEPDELAALKRCQFQVLLANQAQYAVLKDAQALKNRAYQGQDYFPASQTQGYVWHPGNFKVRNPTKGHSLMMC